MECLISTSQTLSDEALVSKDAHLAQEERQATAQLVAAIAELDARRLYLPAVAASARDVSLDRQRIRCDRPRACWRRQIRQWRRVKI
jgi:hypothetical protein